MDEETITPEDVAPVSQLDFDLKPVSEKPSRRYRKGSKYDPILEAFKTGSANLVKVEIEGKDANYIRTQLNKRIDAQSRKYRGIKVSVVNSVCYLEKK
ncbi:hypothetical protein ES702_00728 [subsurface metagenome]